MLQQDGEEQVFDKTAIYDFMESFEDFLPSDEEGGYEKVYRPGWHMEPMQFWFNPPYDENGVSLPSLSGTIILLADGKIMVESTRNGLFYNLDECLGDSIGNFLYALSK